MKTSALLNRLIKARWVCADCGQEYGRHRCALSTWHVAKCDVCKKKVPVTETRDFDYLLPGKIKLQNILKAEMKSKLKPIKIRVKSKAKPKPPGIRKLQKDLWKITSKIVRLLGDKCFTCDKPLAYHDRNPSHFWSQGGHFSAKFDFDNLRVCCTTCNAFKSGNLAEYSVRLLDDIGPVRFEALRQGAKATRRFSREELETMIQNRELILKDLENNL